jgi:hypothetical protein
LAAPSVPAQWKKLKPIGTVAAKFPDLVPSIKPISSQLIGTLLNKPSG